MQVIDLNLFRRTLFYLILNKEIYLLLVLQNTASYFQYHFNKILKSQYKLLENSYKIILK